MTAPEARELREAAGGRQIRVEQDEMRAIAPEGEEQLDPRVCASARSGR